MEGQFNVWWPNFGSVADAHKGWHRSSFGIIPENIQNLRERLDESPRK